MAACLQCGNLSDDLMYKSKTLSQNDTFYVVFFVFIVFFLVIVAVATLVIFCQVVDFNNNHPTQRMTLWRAWEIFKRDPLWLFENHVSTMQERQKNQQQATADKP